MPDLNIPFVSRFGLGPCMSKEETKSDLLEDILRPLSLSLSLSLALCVCVCVCVSAHTRFVCFVGENPQVDAYSAQPLYWSG